MMFRSIAALKGFGSSVHAYCPQVLDSYMQVDGIARDVCTNMTHTQLKQTLAAQLPIF